MNAASPLRKHRLLIATDVPFWRKATGAQQRVAAVVSYLESISIEVRTIFLGQSGSPQFTPADEQAIKEQRLDVLQRSSDQPPSSWRRRFGWYADATLNQLRQWVGENENAQPNGSRADCAGLAWDSAADTQTDVEPISDAAAGQEYAPLKLADFDWPWARGAFREVVDDFKPDTILIEYVTLTYLLDALSYQQRNRIHCLVDTHDILHLRSERFREHGFRHWIDISAKEEAAALERFDTLIAIQEPEAALLQQLAPRCKVIVCGHAPETSELVDANLLSKPPKSTEESAGPRTVAGATSLPNSLRVGYLGSINSSNEQAIISFIKEVWIDVQAAYPGRVQLVIAGSITDRVMLWLAAQSLATQQQLSTNLVLLGYVGRLADFYERVDVAINPVEFGTGLKIKNCEAIAFGRPLLTTPHGAIGLPTSSLPAVKIAASFSAFRERLSQWLDQPTTLSADIELATQLSQVVISRRQAYSALKRAILEPK